MVENAGESNQRIDAYNVFAGLQWFQAFKNSDTELSDVEKVGLLFEIFKEPNDLIGLARVVEVQCGVEGLIEGVVGSYDWADWRINPKLGDVTEQIYLVPHIDVSVTVGYIPLRVVSFRSLRWDEKKNELVKLPSRLMIYRDGQQLEIDEDENHALPFFELRTVEILKDRRIKLEGVETRDDEDDEIIENREREFFSYIFTSDGELEFDMQEKIDREIALSQLAKVAEGPFSVISEKDGFDWKSIREKITKDPLARKALLYFLLPYCDMPATTGEYYVLIEEEVVE